MAGHNGLHRVVKTVKGKKGTAHRAYWVKNDSGPSKAGFLKSHAADIAGHVLGGAMLVAGAAMMAHGYKNRYGATPGAPSHPGVMQTAPRPHVGTFKLPSTSGNRSESDHPHFGAGGMELARAVHFGAGGAEPSRRRGISAANSHALATEFALDRMIARMGRR